MSKMADFYLSIACEVGLDPEDPATLDTVQRAIDRIYNATLPVDVFDEVVDSLLREGGWVPFSEVAQS